MSTIVVAKKNGEAAIAADTLSSMGAMKKSATYKVRSEKILKVEETYLGFVGYAVHQDVFESIVDKNPGDLNFFGRRHIFETFLKLHPILKEKFFLNQSEDDTYESSDIHILLANRSGIFEITPDRNVCEYEFFWATGSGAEYALGAMHQAYSRVETAREIAIAGVQAAAQFDLYTALPYSAYTVVLREQKRSEKNGVREVPVSELLASRLEPLSTE